MGHPPDPQTSPGSPPNTPTWERLRRQQPVITTTPTQLEPVSRAPRSRSHAPGSHVTISSIRLNCGGGPVPTCIWLGIPEEGTDWLLLWFVLVPRPEPPCPGAWLQLSSRSHDTEPLDFIAPVMVLNILGHIRGCFVTVHSSTVLSNT